MTARLWTAAGALVALSCIVAGAGPAAVGAALLLTAVPPPPTVEGIVVGGGALVGVPAVLAVDEPAATVALVAALAVARLVVAARDHRDRRLPMLAAVGAALLVVALLAVRAEEGTWQFPAGDAWSAALAVAGAAAVLAASALPSSAVWARVLVVPVLVVAVPAAGALPPSPAAVVLGVAALAAAWFGGPALALAACALLAATVPAGLPAAWLLAAAAVLATPLAARGPAAAVLGLPGAVAVAAAVVAGPATVPRVVAALAFPAVAVVLARRPGRFPTDVPLPSAPLLVAAAWLLVAPATWDWVGDARIDHWDRGGVLAAVAGVAAVAARRRLPSLLERR